MSFRISLLFTAIHLFSISTGAVVPLYSKECRSLRSFFFFLHVLRLRAEMHDRKARFCRKFACFCVSITFHSVFVFRSAELSGLLSLVFTDVEIYGAAGFRQSPTSPSSFITFYLLLLFSIFFSLFSVSLLHQTKTMGRKRLCF